MGLFMIGLVFALQESCWYLVMDLSFRIPYTLYYLLFGYLGNDPVIALLSWYHSISTEGVLEHNLSLVL